jgi:hypothetical protein
MLLGHHRVAQGVVYGIFIFLLSWFGRFSKIVGGGMLFAQTACTYAVTNSYRNGGAFELHELQDLFGMWAMGAAVSVVVNLVVFPRFASVMLIRHLEKSIDNIQLAIDFLYSRRTMPVTGEELNAMFIGDVATSAELLHQASWEITRQKASIKELQSVVEVMNGIRMMLATCVTEQRYFKALGPQLSGHLERPVEEFVAASREGLDSIKAGFSTKVTTVATHAAKPVEVAESAFTESSAQVTSIIINSLQAVTRASPSKIKELEAASHCISAVLPLAERLQALGLAVALFADRSPTLQLRIVKSLWDYLTTWEISNPLQLPPRENNPFLPKQTITHRALQVLITERTIFAFKVTGAMLCLMAILWSDNSRQFFLRYNLQVVTVPLILALIIPTAGASMLTWVAQLCGSMTGILFGALTVVVWHGVHAQLNV